MGEEIWKDVVGYEGLYQVSNLGRVKSLKYGRTGEERLLKPAKTWKGYLCVKLCKDGKRQKWFVHRLVALSFPEICGEWFEGCQCNHINEDKDDNRASNLNWVTPKENSNWGTRNQRVGDARKGKSLSEEHKNKISETLKGHSVSEEARKKMSESMKGKKSTEEHKKKISESMKGNHNAPTKAVQQFTLEGTLIATYSSAREAQRCTGVKHICKCCNGKYKTAGGYLWMYA